MQPKAVLLTAAVIGHLIFIGEATTHGIFDVLAGKARAQNFCFVYVAAVLLLKAAEKTRQPRCCEGVRNVSLPSAVDYHIVS